MTVWAVSKISVRVVAVGAGVVVASGFEASCVGTGVAYVPILLSPKQALWSV